MSKKFEGYLIASDLDGTFLSSTHGEVDANVDKIRYFISNGGLFTFATGRIAPAVYNMLPRLKEYVNYPAVTCNGMSLYDLFAKKAVREIYTDTNALCELVQFLLVSYPDIAYRGIGKESILSFQKDHYYIVLEEKAKTLPVEIVPLEKWNERRFYKLTLRGDSDILNEVKEVIEREYGNTFSAFKSGDTLLEVQPKGFSKAQMLYEIRDELKREGKDVKLVCIGDHENDLEMLRIADISACPENAIPSVKEICHVCLCHHTKGAVAELIDYIEEKIEKT